MHLYLHKAQTHVYLDALKDTKPDVNSEHESYAPPARSLRCCTQRYAYLARIPRIEPRMRRLALTSYTAMSGTKELKYDFLPNRVLLGKVNIP